MALGTSTTSDPVCEYGLQRAINSRLERLHQIIAALPWRPPLRDRSHRLWRVQDLTMRARDPLLPFAVLSSSARGGHKRKV